MSSYLQGIDAITGASRMAARAARVFGSEDSRASRWSEHVRRRSDEVIGTSALVRRRPTSMSEFLDGIGATTRRDVPDDTLTLVGAAVGALAVPKHRIMGLLGGMSIGRNAPALLHKEYRRDAICNMAHTGSGILGYLMFPAHRVAGFVLAYLAGGAAIYYGGLRSITEVSGK